MIDTITPTHRVGKNNFEVRKDGFGTMSDTEVFKYKEARPDRYAFEILAARVAALEEAKP